MASSIDQRWDRQLDTPAAPGATRGATAVTGDRTAGTAAAAAAAPAAYTPAPTNHSDSECDPTDIRNTDALNVPGEAGAGAALTCFLETMTTIMSSLTIPQLLSVDGPSRIFPERLPEHNTPTRGTA